MTDPDGDTPATWHTPAMALEAWDEIFNHTASPPFIHILHTRFMQEQGHLTHLAWARLRLFQVFCLPTIVHQSSSRFIWIIKTDPHLHLPVLRQLIALVQPYDYIYVVGSNTNFLINPNATGAWRSSELKELHNKLSRENNRTGASQFVPPEPVRVYSGHRRRLALTMALADHLTMLETRLDADDGLHQHYLQYIQDQAVQLFGSTSSSTRQTKSQPTGFQRFKYWCSRRSLEWHWELRHSPPDRSVVAPGGTGVLQVAVHSHMCITPGITVGYPVGVDDSEIPVVEHHLLWHTLTQPAKTTTPSSSLCGARHPSDCVSFVETNFSFDAIRSRTPTSAGMLRVLADTVDTTTRPKKEEEEPTAKGPDSAAAAVALAHHPESSPQNSDSTGLSQNTPWMQYAFWHFAYASFQIARHQVVQVHAYLQGPRLYRIAQDNLAGQCTTFHSCKVRLWVGG